MSDIVDILEAIDHGSVEDCFLQSPMFAKAAAEIRRLRADLEKAKEALRGLLTAPTWADQSPRDMDEEDRKAERLARATLKEIDT